MGGGLNIPFQVNKHGVVRNAKPLVVRIGNDAPYARQKWMEANDMGTFLALWVVFVWAGLVLALSWMVLVTVLDTMGVADAIKRWLRRRGGGRRG